MRCVLVLMVVVSSTRAPDGTLCAATRAGLIMPGTIMRKRLYMQQVEEVMRSW